MKPSCFNKLKRENNENVKKMTVAVDDDDNGDGNDNDDELILWNGSQKKFH